jgi:hypothetical protein
VIHLGGRGLFVCTDRPLPDGKLFPLTLRPREGPARSVVASVLVARKRGTADEPAGMIVTLVDVDDALVGMLERLAKTSDRTDPGVGAARGPSKERTVLGVGGNAQAGASPSNVAPVVVLAPSRERTVLGVAASSAPAVTPPKPQPQVKPAIGAPGAMGAASLPRETSQQEPPPEGWDSPPQADARAPRVLELPLEPSIPIALPQPAAPAAPSSFSEPRIPVPLAQPVPVSLSELSTSTNEPSLVPAGVPRHRGRKVILFLAVVAVVAVGYVRREQLRPVLQRIHSLIASTIHGSR